MLHIVSTTWIDSVGNTIETTSMDNINLCDEVARPVFSLIRELERQNGWEMAEYAFYHEEL